MRIATLTLAVDPDASVGAAINASLNVEQMSHANGMQVRRSSSRDGANSSSAAVAVAVVGRGYEATLHVRRRFVALAASFPRGSTLINTAVLDGVARSLPVMLQGVERSGAFVTIASPDRCVPGDAQALQASPG